MGSFPHIIPHKPSPWIKGTRNFTFFKKKIWLQAQNFGISSGTTQERDYGSICTTQTTTLGKEGQLNLIGYNRQKNHPLLPVFITISQHKSAIDLTNSLGGNEGQSTPIQKFYSGGRGGDLPSYIGTGKPVASLIK